MIKKIYICDRCKEEKTLTSYDLPVFKKSYIKDTRDVILGKIACLKDKERIDLCDDCKRELANIITYYLEDFEEGRRK